MPRFLRAFENDLSIFELIRVNYAAGALYAEITNALLDKAGLGAGHVDVVGYDGQTIYQEPPDRSKMANQNQNQNQNQTQRERERESESQSLVDRWTKASYPCGLFIAESGVVAALTNHHNSNAVPASPLPTLCVVWGRR